jgi:hypothetical protein
MFYKNTELVCSMMWYSLLHAASSGLNIYANGWRTAFAVCYTGEYKETEEMGEMRNEGKRNS